MGGGVAVRATNCQRWPSGAAPGAVRLEPITRAATRGRLGSPWNQVSPSRASGYPQPAGASARTAEVKGSGAGGRALIPDDLMGWTAAARARGRPRPPVSDRLAASPHAPGASPTACLPMREPPTRRKLFARVCGIGESRTGWRGQAQNLSSPTVATRSLARIGVVQSNRCGDAPLLLAGPLRCAKGAAGSNE